MPPHIREQVLKLHPYQLQKFMELLAWSNGGTNEGSQPSWTAYEKAIAWAQQVEIPPPALKPLEGEE